MNLQDYEIAEIKEKFASMQTKGDFLSLLNYVKKIVYGVDAKSFEVRHLNYYIQPLNQQYVQFSIKKKNGSDRIINAPNKGLKSIQRCLNIILQAIYVPGKNTFGFISGKSIIDNAQRHVGELYVYNIDLKDFFFSVDQARIWGRLKHPPFNLSEESGRLKIANMIASLCCQELSVERIEAQGECVIMQKRVLPQGAPTSPIMTNIICERLDFLLSAVAKRFGLKYSRYADDITFSSMHNVYQNNGEFAVELKRIIKQQGFVINDNKTRLQKTGYRQEVTGLIVNEKVNVSQRYVKQIRQWLYYWETYGYTKASSFFCSKYKANKGNIKKSKPNMAKVVLGKLEFLKMVKGYNNSTYLKLKERYDKLVSDENTGKTFSRVEKSGTKDSQKTLHKSQSPDPKDVSGFMSLFNKRNGLKYLTHGYDEDRDFEIDEFLRSSEELFKRVTLDDYRIPKSLWTIVNEFAFKSDQIKWTTISEDYKKSIRIEIGWASKELRDWSKQTKLHPIMDEKYKQVINDFRRITRIESPNLETLIKNTIEKGFSDKKNDFKIETIDLSKADFYTHVGFLKTALETVFEEIKERAKEENQKRVKIEYKRETEGDYFVRKILITHYNSFPTKELAVLLDEWNSFDKGCMGKIGKNMQGYCHWSVVTKIEESPIKVNILKEKDTPDHERVDPSEAVGFTHIFTFYYK